MKFLIRAFAIMVAVNLAAFLWMGLFLGDWNPSNLDSVVRDLVEKVTHQGPLFWAAYALGLVLFETIVIFMALLLSLAVEGVFWSTVLVSIAILGLTSLKAWDIQKSVKQVKKQAQKAAEKAGDKAGNAVEKTLNEAEKAAEKAADEAGDALKKTMKKAKEAIPNK